MCLFVGELRPTMRVGPAEVTYDKADVLFFDFPHPALQLPLQ